jgi:hypothetical protein
VLAVFEIGSPLCSSPPGPWSSYFCFSASGDDKCTHAQPLIEKGSENFCLGSQMATLLISINEWLGLQARAIALHWTWFLIIYSWTFC